MNKFKPTLVLLAVILISLTSIAQTTFTENAASFGLNIPNPKDGGHAWSDYDNDGDQDVLINFNSTSIRNYLMRNNGDGTFTNVQPTLVPGMLNLLAERQAAWGDVNNDGRPDFLMNSHGTSSIVAIQIFVQNTDGTFGDGLGGTAPITVGESPTATVTINPLNTEGAGFFDFEGDGDLDVFFDNHDYGIELLRNNSIDHLTHTVNPSPSPLFTHITPGNGSGVVDLGLDQNATDGDFGTSADVNDDGWVDIFMRKRNQNDFFLNQGGTFTNGADLGQAYNDNKGGNGLWDLDNDGDLDAVWTESGLTQIYRNDGPGVWTALGSSVFPSLPQPSDTDSGTSTAGIDALAGGDIDNDGDIDILLVGDSRSYLYINQLNSPTPAPGVIGSGSAMSFTLDSQTFNSGQDGEGTTFIDIDDDGDLDIYMNINNSANQLFINNLPSENRINHLLIDVTEDRGADGSTGGYPGRAAIGTNVLIKDCKGNIISGLRQVNGVYGHGTQIPEEVHFGLPLGEDETYLIEVHYPNFYSPTEGITRLFATAIAQPSTIDGTNHYSLTTTDAEKIQNDNAPDAEDDFELIASSDTISVQLNLFDNDSDADGDSIYIESIVQPAVGSVVIDDADAGLVTYTYNVSGTPFTGTTFEYTVSDAVILCTALGKKDTAEVILFIDPPTSATLDFDGINDFVDSDFDFSGMTQTTVMTWIKLDSDFSSTGVIIAQGDFLLDVNSSKRVSTSVNNGTIFLPAASALQVNKWYHLAAIFDNSLSSDKLKLYLNGVLMDTNDHTSLSSPIVTSSEKFTIGKNSKTNNKYFKGAIDEVRVFDTALTESQLHQLIHQEIENNSGSVKGKVVPKNIKDFSTSATISWANLMAYYPMTDINSSRTIDYSSYGNNATLNNITSVQPQTAPMPYQTTADGNLSASNTWLSGDVWDITDNLNTNPWSIIKVSHNVSTNNNIYSKGLIIDSGKTLTITGDKEVRNDWFLELNGTLDLQDDSQLVQTENSDLVTSVNGKVLRRQEGNTNYYWYNYWSSPVGTLATTSLIDNNTSLNNSNNTAFSLNMLKESNGDAVTFTSAYDNVGDISTRWLYTFQNGIDYWGWSAITPSSSIQPGFGYTQKGTGNAGTEQQYIFEGKPNNGTILIAANDVEGDDGVTTESVKNVSLTTTLIGNPYPSALNAIQFINDNKPGTGSGVISGTIQLWEQWAGNSHYLLEYEGGYGYINNTATERAYQHADIPLAVEGHGIKDPTNFIPVGQGFFVEVINDGNIEFNNGQRVFKKENTGESTFYRTTSENPTTETEQDNSLQLIRLEFSTSQGSTRRFVLGFGDEATDGFDYGFDGGVVYDLPADDMGSLLNDKQYVIQAYSPITADKVVDLNLNASGNYSYSLKISELENIDDSQEIYLRDNLTNTYFNLRNNQTYEFTSEAGIFSERFDVVFQTEDTLSNEDFGSENVLIYVNNFEDKLFVKELSNQVQQLNLTNMLGQVVKTYTKINKLTLENGIDISNLSSGVYIVSIQTENNQTIDKKVIIN